jgi:hypothetical protein
MDDRDRDGWHGAAIVQENQRHRVRRRTAMDIASTDSLSANDACSPLFALDDLPTQRRLVSDLSQPQSVRFEARRGRVSAALANRGGVPRKRQQSSGYR